MKCMIKSLIKVVDFNKCAVKIIYWLWPNILKVFLFSQISTKLYFEFFPTSTLWYINCGVWTNRKTIHIYVSMEMH